ncbi:hypothetical protein [Paragemmobacter aquarius]|nr:hypothetical protein [Gemmobacter aquarius]
MPPMEILSDLMLGLGAFGAMAYCHILSGRLKRFNALESGMGGAIAVLSAQVDDMTRALNAAQRQAQQSSEGLSALVARGDAAAARLELLMASMHDLPDEEPGKRLRVVRRRGAFAEAAE